MKFMTKTRLALLATVATVTLIQPAMALDAQAFVDRLAATYTAMGVDVQPGAASLDGTTITVKGVKFGPKGGEMMSIDTDLTFTGVVEQADGSYLAEGLTMPDVEYDIPGDQKGHLSLKDIVVTGVYVPAAGASNYMASMQQIGSASAGPLSITRNGVEVISFTSISSENTFNPAQGSAELVDVSSTLSVEGFKADLSTVGESDPAAGATITALGLTNVSGSISESQTWSIADGNIIVEELLITLDDKGSFGLGFDLAGFTPAVMELIIASSAAASDTTKTPEQLQQESAAMGMQLMSSISINSMWMRYDDASLAGSLLDFFAAQQGGDRAAFVEGLKGMAAGMLAGVGVPELDAIVVPAVNAFLDDPKSLEVVVAPETSTTLITLMGAAANPAGLITMLGLTVTANQAVAE